jgi:hypothetical protein
MTSSEILYTKIVFKELSFLVLTHTTYFDIRFGRYRFLKSGFTVGHTRCTGAWSGFWAKRCAKLVGV